MGLIADNKSHLSAYALMDISLDTFPYAGTTTTCESLYMGVPCLTLRGDNHAFNVGCSLLAQIDSTKLYITNSVEEYIDRAVYFSRNLDLVTEIRKTLRQDMLSSYLCDGSSFTKNIELIYRDLWEKWIENSKKEN